MKKATWSTRLGSRLSNEATHARTHNMSRIEDLIYKKLSGLTGQYRPTWLTPLFIISILWYNSAISRRRYSLSVVREIGQKFRRSAWPKSRNQFPYFHASETTSENQTELFCPIDTNSLQTPNKSNNLSKHKDFWFVCDWCSVHNLVGTLIFSLFSLGPPGKLQDSSVTSTASVV
jgi:hypothetical protein